MKHGLQSVSDFLHKDTGHIHFVGICGIGMAGLAFLLKTRGFRVSGCDLSPNRMAEWLASHGIHVLSQHDPGHIEADMDLVIRSSAVPLDCAEISAARESGVPVFSRGVVLPELLTGHRSVAVSGTHGKTTTAAFITELLNGSGCNTSWCIGGECDALGGVAGAGNKVLNAECRMPNVKEERECSAIGNRKSKIENIIVVEADESDGTLAFYRPDIAVVTNVEFDHMEHFENIEALEECFRRFIQNAGQKVVFCADDPRAAALVRGQRSAAAVPLRGTKAPKEVSLSAVALAEAGGQRSDGGGDARFVSYGFSDGADVRGRNLRETASSLSFTMEHMGKELGRVQVPVTGAHNALNTLAAAAVALELGLSFEEIRKRLGHVSLPRRRFERIVEKDNVLVISDYAHHPSEISALIRTAGKLEHSRLLVVFQPHRYTRTLALGRDFPPAFKGVDELILTPVYPASEKPLKGGTMWDLYGHWRGRKQRSEVLAATSLEQAWAYLRHELRDGDILLIVGAGDVEKIAEWAKEGIAECGPRLGGASCGLVPLCGIADLGVPSEDFLSFINQHSSISISLNEPLADRTTLKVGGKSDIWAEISSVRDLASILRWTNEKRVPFNLMGAGSNMLVSDLGVRGITARLVGHEFCSVTPAAQHSNTPVVVVGAGVTLVRLMNWLQEHGWAGLEFLEGIPGTVGGALRMNAGAWGHELGEHVSWIRSLNMDGSECIVEKTALGLGYRRCACLEKRVLVEACLTIKRGVPVEIRKRRSGIAVRREWMRGLRSAGSVFKNPPGDFAGRLIEKAGLKGRTIGGAAISTDHANVITTEEGACASDVIALIENMRSEVQEQFGVRLDTEIVVLER